MEGRVVAQCVIYTRVSTRQQAWGHGLIRQLETCVDRARKDKTFIVAVFTDVCSGASRQPNRDLAIAEAIDHDCPIYVESMDRWSRKGADDPALFDNVVVCADFARDFNATISSLVNGFVTRATEATDGSRSK